MADYRQLAGALTNSDTIQATPRNPVLGGVADLLGMAYKLPEMPRMGVPGIDFLAANRKKVLDLLGMGDVQKTADTLSYGGAIGTGSGMTYRPKDETIDAALTVAPMVAPAARMAGQSAMATGRAGERLAERVVPQIMERGGLPAEMLGAMGNRTISPLDVYHGSPHTFPPTARNPLGEFDASKIGTGEGAQAYGHGIYMSEAPSVAKSYQSSVSAMHKAQGKSVADVTIQGKSIDWDDPVQVAAFELERHNGDRAAAAAFHAKTFAGGENNAAVKILKSKQQLPSVDLPGNLYKVDLPDEKIAKMLDWDKPLSQQTPEVQALAKKFGYPLDRTGADFQRWASSPSGGLSINLQGPKDQRGLELQAARMLRQADIPGIQYLDAGSRNVAKGTRNFVVFPGEEKSMTILERNAQKK